MAINGAGNIAYTPEELAQKWNEYREAADNSVKYEVSAGKVLTVPYKRVYTLEGFCSFANIHRDTFHNYSKQDAYKVACGLIESEVFARKHDALVNAEGSTTGLIFDMKANYGINEKNLHEHSGGTKITVEYVSPESQTE